MLYLCYCKIHKTIKYLLNFCLTLYIKKKKENQFSSINCAGLYFLYVFQLRKLHTHQFF